MSKHTVHNINLFHPEQNGKWYILRDFNSISEPTMYYPSEEIANEIAAALDYAEARKESRKPKEAENMSTDEKPKFDWTKPVHIWQMHNTGDVRFFSPDGQAVEPRAMDGDQARDALLDLHDTVEGLRGGVKVLRDVTEDLIGRVKTLETLSPKEVSTVCTDLDKRLKVVEGWLKDTVVEDTAEPADTDFTIAAVRQHPEFRRLCHDASERHVAHIELLAKYDDLKAAVAQFVEWAKSQVGPYPIVEMDEILDKLRELGLTEKEGK